MSASLRATLTTWRREGPVLAFFGGAVSLLGVFMLLHRFIGPAQTYRLTAVVLAVIFLVLGTLYARLTAAFFTGLVIAGGFLCRAVYADYGFEAAQYASVIAAGLILLLIGLRQMYFARSI